MSLAVLCGSCDGVHEVEDNATYCVVCEMNYDSGCMTEVEGEPVCFKCEVDNGR